ncbi:molecular chaperone [Basilea psittacipulmonis DSM 24701]|uniref:Molecular chaperone n=1 Tax=Basilea psittacipulmonis DSM 24701 TaxID=1072685 RepID=A0A077DBE3_9BURK|nr:molecular chaperone [Basilea psittacipulmonis DSM 24701]
MFFVLCFVQGQANVIMATRVIYPSDQKSVSLELTNSGKRPSLVQVWIDNGNPDASPEKITAPFVVTPPVARVDNGKGQTLRITYTGEPLPTDRESIFYVNVLDIPPKPKAGEASPNYLQIAIRSRIKLFFRPTTLSISPSEAYQQVKWSLENSKGKTYLVADNPTPYYITYGTLYALQNGKKIQAPNADMVAPFSQARFLLNSPIKSAKEIIWTTINDYGGRTKGTTELH